MQLIVNELEAAYGEQVAFRYYNALDGGAGQQAFEQTGIRGHPGFILFMPDGAEVSRWLGIVEREVLREAVEAVIGEAQPQASLTP